MSPAHSALGERDQVVFGLLLQGMRKTDIAARLFICPSLVTYSVRRIYAATGCLSLVELGAYAERNGLKVGQP